MVLKDVDIVSTYLNRWTDKVDLKSTHNIHLCGEMGKPVLWLSQNTGFVYSSEWASFQSTWEKISLIGSNFVLQFYIH